MTYEPSEDREKYPDHQMTPLKGGRYKTILHGPPGTEVGDLHCDLEPYIEGGRPAIISHSGWLPTDEHVKQLEAGGHVRLSVWQHPIPPLAVAVEGPVCACHGEEMVWDPDDAGYYCRHNGRTEDAPNGEDAGRSALEELRKDFTPGPVEGEDED